MAPPTNRKYDSLLSFSLPSFSLMRFSTRALTWPYLKFLKVRNLLEYHIYLLFCRSGSLDFACLSTMTIILSGSLSWKLFTFWHRSSKEYLYLYGLIILL